VQWRHGLSTFLIHSGTLVCMDAAGTVNEGPLLVRDGVIAAIGTDAVAALEAQGVRPDETFDATGGFVLPGFVQAHLHLCQTMFRGLAEQSDLLRWLRERIWPYEHAHTEASLSASTRLGLVEMLAAGVTCLNDMGTVRHTEVIGSVLESSGIRAVFGKALMDQGTGVPRGMAETPKAAIEDALAVAARFHGAAGGRLHVSLAPRFILSCSEGLWRDVVAAARERGLVIHTHIAESPREAHEVEAVVGTTAARYFAKHDVLSERFVGAHGIWLEEDELSSLAGTRAALVHCPASNLKLGSGFARVRGWLDHGIRCGLGSDGAACSNRLDPFHDLALAGGISRALDPERPLSARETLELATRRGAEALGLGDVTGSLEVGKQADVVVVDARAAHMAPNAAADPMTTVVHAARAGDVRLTMVAGRALYRDGAWTTLDPEHAVADARAEIRGLLRRVEAA